MQNAFSQVCSYHGPSNCSDMRKLVDNIVHFLVTLFAIEKFPSGMKCVEIGGLKCALWVDETIQFRGLKCAKSGG